MSVQREVILKQLQELDVAACDANSLWHKLESMKRLLIRRHSFSDAELKDAGIWIAEENQR